MHSHPARAIVIPGSIMIWLGCVAFGFHRLAAWAHRPGPVPASVRTDWPAHLPVAPSPAGCTLIVTIHPECSCSHATLEELKRVVSAVPSLKTCAVFEDYGSLPVAVTETRLWKMASSIPGLVAVTDPGQKIATLLSARTSGEARLYSPSGKLLFSGGLTSSRGHAGANPASDAVISLASGQPSPPRLGLPTFGCSLGSRE